ncbi:hypothetical protein HZS_4161, partial [Henneguya salminicola]
MEKNLADPEKIFNTIVETIDKLISDSRKTYSNLHNTCLSLKLRIQESDIYNALENKNQLNWEELDNIYLLSASTRNTKIIENCLNLYNIIIWNRLLHCEIIASIQNHLDILDINPYITVRILQLITKIITIYHVHSSDLRGYISFCMRMACSTNGNIRDASWHTTIQICLILIDKISLHCSDPEQDGFCFKDIIRMMLGEQYNWLCLENKPEDLFLIQLLSEMIHRAPSAFVDVVDLKIFLSNDILDGLVKIVCRFSRIFEEPTSPYMDFPFNAHARQGSITLNCKSIRKFTELIKLIHFVVNHYFTLMPNPCIKILGSLSEMVQPTHPVLIRIYILNFFQGLLKDAKFISFILGSYGKSMLITVSTYCLTTLTSDMNQTTNDFNNKSNGRKSSQIDFWEIFYQIQTRPRHQLWENIDRLSASSVTNEHLACYGTFILLTIPRIAYDFINKQQEINEELHDLIVSIISLVFINLDSEFDFSHSLKAQKSFVDIVEHNMYENFNAIFIQSKNSSDNSLIDFLNSLSLMFDELPLSKHNSFVHEQRQSFILGRLFDLYVQNCDIRPQLIIKPIISVYIKA